MKLTPGAQPRTQRETLQRAVAAVTDRLPDGWSMQLKHPVSTQLPAVVDITSPSSEQASFVAETRMNVAGRDIEQLRMKLQDTTANFSSASNGIQSMMIIAPYLSRPVRKRLEKARLSYADLTGNMRLELSKPGLFMLDRGVDADPWRGPGRPRGTLKGEPAARVVRALTDFNMVWTMRELVNEAGTSTGAAYRVIDYLEREGHVIRDEKRRVHVLDWAELLRAWSADYSLIGSNRTTRWIAPRGLQHLLERLADPDAQQPDQVFRHAVTGTIAAAEWAPYAPTSAVAIYVSDTDAAAAAWGLYPAETGANTLLVEPSSDVMLERTTTNDAGLRLAAPPQVVVDLLTGPGRNPSEAEKLLERLQQYEEVWRPRHLHAGTGTG